VVAPSPETSYNASMPSVALDGVSDEHLVNTMIALQLACGRSRGSMVRRRGEWFCFLFRTLDIERQARGLPPPPSHRAVGDLPPAPQGL
jgi:hypothetical protein